MVCELEWRPVYAFTVVSFGVHVLSCPIHGVNKHRHSTQLSAFSIRHDSTNIILFLTSTHKMGIKQALFTHRLRAHPAHCSLAGDNVTIDCAVHYRTIGTRAFKVITIANAPVGSSDNTMILLRALSYQSSVRKAGITIKWHWLIRKSSPHGPPPNHSCWLTRQQYIFLTRWTQKRLLLCSNHHPLIFLRFIQFWDWPRIYELWLLAQRGVYCLRTWSWPIPTSSTNPAICEEKELDP